MLTVEQYITQMKKKDNLDEFNFKNHAENMAAVMKYDPKEARKMVSNLSETLKKAYDDAVIAGKIEVAQNMLAKDMDEKLISEVSGLPMEQINTLKKNIGKLH